MELTLLFSPKISINECTPDDENDAVYYKKLLDTLSDKLGLKSCLNGADLHSTIKKLIDDHSEQISECLHLGIAALYFFIQLNFTGPDVSVDDMDWLSNKHNESRQELALEDQCNDNARHLELLFLAKIIFTHEKVKDRFPVAVWWLIRANYIHQLVHDETSNALLEECEPLIDQIEQLNFWNEENKKFQVLFNIEVAHFWLLYRRINNCEKHLKKAQEIAKLSLELEGAMGKRTKFQQEEKPQLFLHIETGEKIFPFEVCPNVPISVNLIDDLRLETVKFSQEIKKPELGSVEESIVLAKCIYLQMNQPKDNFAEEEIMPYINVKLLMKSH